MALEINRILRDDDSRATFEVVSDTTGGESATIVDVSALTGSNGNNVDMVKVIGATCLVCDNSGSGSGGNVTLSWTDGSTTTDFLTFPVGQNNISMHCAPPTNTFLTADILLTSSADMSFTLRLVVEKVRGFDYSIVNLLK